MPRVEYSSACRLLLLLAWEFARPTLLFRNDQAHETGMFEFYMESLFINAEGNCSMQPAVSACESADCLVSEGTILSTQLWPLPSSAPVCACQCPDALGQASLGSDQAHARAARVSSFGMSSRCAYDVVSECGWLVHSWGCRARVWQGPVSAW